MKYVMLILVIAGTISISGCNNQKGNTEGNIAQDTVVSNEDPTDKDTVTVKLNPVVEDTTKK